MESLERKNFLDTKFSLDNLKKQKKSILKNQTTFTGFDLLGIKKDIMIKEYYDLPDFFLQSEGITVNKNSIKGEKQAELVVRFDTGRERIQFLSNIPDTFSLEIPVKDSIYKYQQFIADSISALVPSGLNVDLFQLAGQLSKICTVKKKRERHTMINYNGLKVTLSFQKAEYESSMSKNREIVDMLEITSFELSQVEKYDAFIKKISFNNPTIIKLKSSDIQLAQEYLFKDKK